MNKCEQCIVREFSALKALNKDELIRIADCKTSYVVKKGETIFDEGDSLNGIYCIKDGVCKLSKLSDNGKDQIVKLVKKGELLGQRSLISEESTNLSAIAIEDMQVCFIPKQEILQFFNENNQFSLNMMKSVCGDLKDADDNMVNLAQKTTGVIGGCMLFCRQNHYVKCSTFLDRIDPVFLPMLKKITLYPA